MVPAFPVPEQRIVMVTNHIGSGLCNLLMAIFVFVFVFLLLLNLYIYFICLFIFIPLQDGVDHDRQNEMAEVEAPAQVADENPLFAACKTGHLAVVKQLVTESKVDVNQGDEKCWTPFLMACSQGPPRRD